MRGWWSEGGGKDSRPDPEAAEAALTPKPPDPEAAPKPPHFTQDSKSEKMSSVILIPRLLASPPYA